MRLVGVLQARMTSSRLPGKVLAPILGAPMLSRQVERVRRAGGLDELVIATSTDRSDDPVAALGADLGLPVVRGSLDDVLGRFLHAIDVHGADAVVRLTADCPLASPAVIEQAINEFRTGQWDYVSNTLTPTWPDGVDVEVVRSAALAWVDRHSTDPHEREHVTLGVYRHPEVFALRNITGTRDLSALRWTVDEPDDLAFVRDVYENLYPSMPEFEVDDVVDLLDRGIVRSRTTEQAARNAALDGLDTGAMDT